MRPGVVHRQRYLPLDPDCEAVAEFLSGAGGETWAAFARRHRGECERCTLYGIQNMTMDAPAPGFTAFLTRPAVAAWRSQLPNGAQSQADSTVRNPT